MRLRRKAGARSQRVLRFKLRSGLLLTHITPSKESRGHRRLGWGSCGFLPRLYAETQDPQLPSQMKKIRLRATE